MQDEFTQSAPDSRVGTPAYLPPEVIANQQGQRYDAKVRAGAQGAPGIRCGIRGSASNPTPHNIQAAGAQSGAQSCVPPPVPSPAGAAILHLIA